MMKTFYFISMATLIITFLIGLLIAFWTIFPYEPVVFNDKEFPVLTPHVKQGENVRYTSNYCKYMDLPATLSRSFVNGLIFSTPISITNRVMGCHAITVEVYVPKELPVGYYRLQNNYSYQVNPLRTINLTEYTEEFEVIE